MKEFFLAIFLIGVLLCIASSQETHKCGYESCPKFSSDKINVHIVPHSHDDVGWLKTVDEYYYGVSTEVSVNSIITSVFEALKRDPSRRFTQVETAFFWKWWQDQTDGVKEEYRELVENGQIEIANGGWVMNDEACPNYQSIIDQFTLGLRRINQTLGSCGKPKIGWQIDTFGHSRQQAQIFKEMGFDGVFFARLDYQDRLHRMKTKTMDFLWKSSPSLDNSEIFYSILMNHYGSPDGFCFDALCADDAIVDNVKSFEYNADQKMKDFEAVILKYATYSTTNNILIPMGGDFNYQLAEQQYINMDKLMKLFRNHEKFNVFYSSPMCYVKAVNEHKPNLTVKTDDFFPYSSGIHEFWTGYYTSRPNIKRLERLSHNILQANKFLRAIATIKLKNAEFNTDLESLEESTSTLLHHDAITGTERAAVANNYEFNIKSDIKKAEESIGTIVGQLLAKSPEHPIGGFNLSSCSLDESCENSLKERFVVAVYNPLSRPVSTIIRLPVDKNSSSVTGPNGVTQFDIINFKDDRHILINAKDIPPMGMNLYYVTAKTSQNVEYVNESQNSWKFGTEETNFELNSYSMRLKSVTMRNITLYINQDFYYYMSENGQHEQVASGAYLFRPLSGTTLKEITYLPYSLEYSHRGELVDEAHIRINEWLKQIIRVYKTEKDPYIEFDWTVGPIDVNETSLIGKEIISRFELSNFHNKGIFYTDSNGKDMIQRTRNALHDYSSDTTDEPTSRNYYPVTSKIVMRDEERNLEVAVLNDRCQGATSLLDGKIEIMIHRRLLVDDNKGLGEPLDDSSIVRGKHLLVFGPITDSNGSSLKVNERNLELKHLMAPYILTGDASSDDMSLEKLKSTTDFQFKFLANSLPDNVNIISFEKWNDEHGSYLLRLEHIMEKDDNSELSKPVTVDLNGIFQNNLTSVKETLLGGNQLLDTHEKLLWDEDNSPVFPSESKEDNMYKITLKPTQIRTFIVTF